MREIALDTETTGLDPLSGHRIVEIGAVEMQQHIRTGNHFHAYLNPQRDMPAEAQQVHGLSAEFLQDKPLFRDVADALLEFIGDATLVIHNASFDMKFLNAELERIGYPPLEMSRTIDTVMIARKQFPGQPANLDALCRRFNVDTSRRVKHGALLDAELLCEVYLELRGGRQVRLGLDVGQQTLPGDAALETPAAKAVVARVYAITPEEKSAHRHLIDKIKNPIWRKYFS